MSVIYLCLGVMYVLLTLPRPEGIPHDDRFYDKVRSDLRVEIGTPGTTDKSVSDNWVRIGKPLPPLPKSVQMPNGHTIYFKTLIADKGMEEVATEYWKAVERQARREQFKYIIIALLFIAGPILIVYVLGRSIYWVYIGFKQK